MSELTIVGGGITGLTAAYLAAKAGHKVRLIERDSSYGGLLDTFEIGGSRLEYYYHHFFTHDVEFKWLLGELALENELVFYKSSMGVYREGNIYNFNSPKDLLKYSPINFLDKIRFALTSLYLWKMAKWEEWEHTAAIHWLEKWAGKSTTESLWKPMLQVKFDPYVDEVPLAWMIGRLKQRMNSRTNGDEKLGYLNGSMQVLLDALLLQLKKYNVELVNNAKLEQLVIENNTLKAIKTTAGDFEGGQFLLTTPTTYISELLKEAQPELSADLAQIKYFGAVCTILELEQPLSSLYWLNIAEKNYPFGGVIEHTNLIPAKIYNNTHIAYLSRYFSSEENIATMSNEEIKAFMLAPLSKIYPQMKPSWIKKVHIFKSNHAAVVCDLNFSKKVPSCKTAVENLYLANMAHVYPDERSVNNAIRIAVEACKVMDLGVENIPYNTSLSGKIGF